MLSIRQLILILVYAVMLFFIVLMAVALQRSLKKTLYSYLNIGLIAGILFLSVLSAILLSSFIQSLSLDSIPLSYYYFTMLNFPKQFSIYGAGVILAVCLALAVSNIALMRHEGVCLHNTLSLVLAAFFIGGTVFVHFFARQFEGLKYISLFLLLMLCYFECVLAGTAIMGYAAAKQVPSHDKDFIIIPGCSIDKRGGLLPLLKGRVNRAIRFAWEQEIDTGKPLKYIPSGGQGANEVMSEASAMELYLMVKGAEPFEVFPERKSRNTLENMRLSKKITDQWVPDAKVAIATTNYHMLRSGILARKVGLDAEGIAGDTKWYFWPNGFIREFFAILAMNVRTHIIVAALMAALCAAAAVVGKKYGM